MQQFQEQMDVIGNNIANVNTTGFKGARVNFADAFSETLRAASPGDGTTSSTSAMQIGSGVTTSAIQNLYTQGALNRTGVPDDLAVSGAGYFVVRDAASGETFATRDGHFHRDQNGYLINDVGLRLQGFSDNSLSTPGDIKIDTAGLPAPADPNASLQSYSIGKDGKINVVVRRSDNTQTQFVRGQILLQNFTNPDALMKEGGNLYSGITAAGPLGGNSPQGAPPDTNGLGRIESGSLELSNVDLATQFADLITTQRAFQASARIITTSDEMLQELVNLKR
jgi:flagellar hook protein FlgE